MSVLKDKEGKESSKRLAGFIGLGISFIITILAIYSDKSGNAKELLPPWLVFSGTCLGLGVIEKVRGNGK